MIAIEAQSPSSTRHPSESWGIHGACAVVANRDTPAFAGVTGVGVARDMGRATGVGLEGGK